MLMEAIICYLMAPPGDEVLSTTRVRMSRGRGAITRRGAIIDESRVRMSRGATRWGAVIDDETRLRLGQSIQASSDAAISEPAGGRHRGR